MTQTGNKEFSDGVKNSNKDEVTQWKWRALETNFGTNEKNFVIKERKGDQKM